MAIDLSRPEHFRFAGHAGTVEVDGTTLTLSGIENDFIDSSRTGTSHGTAANVSITGGPITPGAFATIELKLAPLQVTIVDDQDATTTQMTVSFDVFVPPIAP